MKPIFCLVAALFICLESAGAQLKKPPASRTISFSSYVWTVKRSTGVTGPGPCIFSDSEKDVFVDSEGRLHLKITRHQGKWVCAEVVSLKSFGYGTYHFEMESSMHFDPQAVWGLFTWHIRDPAYSHREVDIEFSRWGCPVNQNAQFVV